MATRRWLAIASLACSIGLFGCGGCGGGDDQKQPDGSTVSDAKDAGTNHGSTDEDAGSTTPVSTACRWNSDCASGEVCRDVRGSGRICTPECREDRDCCGDGSTTCGRVCASSGCVDSDPESCNGLDDDRDGVVDNGYDFVTDELNCGRCGFDCTRALAHVKADGAVCESGVCHIAEDGCADGFQNINGSDADGCEYPCTVTNSGIEEPDNDDNNCDGAIDEGFACRYGSESACGVGTGICQEGVQTCTADGTWSACADAVGSRVESCNGLDDDCDNVADNGFDLETSTANCGACGNDCLQIMPHSDASCVAGECVFGECQTNHLNLNEDETDGCEYACPVVPVLANEVCDTQLLDDDCDGEQNEGCACTDGQERRCGLEDPTRNNIGICHFGIQTCTDGQWDACEGAQAPLLVELCNGLDDDCDGTVPANEADTDRDGYRVCDDDCNDNDRSVNPEATELCDGFDNDCDDTTDENFSVGVVCRGVGACAAVVGQYECADVITSRCSIDFNGSAWAGAVETANNRDDDCDGTVDEGFACAENARRCGLDNPTQDGVGICRRGLQECVDGAWGSCDGAVAPAAESCNGLDDDCDGTVPANEADTDRDGYRVCADDCNDNDAAIRPTASESCNGTDDDCDDATDEDYFVGVLCDGVGGCGIGIWECDGTQAHRCSTNPGGLAFPSPAPTEVCDNGIDEDCDGVADDECGQCRPGDRQACGTTSVGACELGEQLCGAGRVWGGCVGAVAPATSESCNGLDDDCDGTVPANEADADRDGYRVCANDCNDAKRDENPDARERCNSVDDDCDGETDEDYFVGNPCQGVGACGRGVWECDGPNGFRCSTDPDGSADASTTETCNDVDDDCDGMVDDVAIGPATTDPNHCGGCGRVCAVGNSLTECVAPGICTVTGCKEGYDLVDGSCLHCDVWPALPDEVCDSAHLDEDCSGERNEGCACTNGATQLCGLDPALDGIGVCRYGRQTCASGAWGACTGVAAPSVEVCNGLDDDCDGVIPMDERDVDGDGYRTCEGDCNDADPLARPGTSMHLLFPNEVSDPEGILDEPCDGRDNDCDGRTDERIDDVDLMGRPCFFDSSWYTQRCPTGVWECNLVGDFGYHCSSDPSGSDYPNPPPDELCDNNADDDCDGMVDEGCGSCTPNAWTVCGIDPTLHGAGICRVGTQQCGADREWDSCEGVVHPSVESCDGEDDDCDGVTDNGFTFATDTANCGACGNDCRSLPNVLDAACAGGACGSLLCRTSWWDLDGNAVTGCEYNCIVRNGGVEVCNRIDDNCDGQVDEDPFCAQPPAAIGNMSFSVVLPSGFPVDATRVLCGTFASGSWECGGYALSVGADGRTVTMTGSARTGTHTFTLCTARCNEPAFSSWVVVRLPDGTISDQGAVLTLAFIGTVRSTTLVVNAAGNGGNWTAVFTAP